MNGLAELLRLALAAAIAANAEARRCSERLAGRAIAFESMDRRIVLAFEAGSAHVAAGDADADATVRGSPAALLGALAGDHGGTAAVLGDAALFEDFAESFRPHLELPPGAEYWAEDAADALRAGVGAARSAAQGAADALRRAMRDYRPSREHPDAAREIDALRARVGELDQRLRELEKP